MLKQERAVTLFEESSGTRAVIKKVIIVHVVRIHMLNIWLERLTAINYYEEYIGLTSLGSTGEVRH